jgi:FkbM family methyltransferase
VLEQLLAAAGRSARWLPHSQTKIRLGRALALALGDPAAVPADLDGTLIYLRPGGRTCGSAFWDGRYEPVIQALLGDLIDSASTVLDIGANVGLIGIPLAPKVAPAGRVLLFEPVEANCDLIRRTLGTNDLPNVELVPVGLGDGDGRLEIHLEGRRGRSENAILAPPVSGDRATTTVEIAVTTLDAVLRERDLLDGVDAIKIDVEGAEVAVLRGAAETLARSLPVIVGEFNALYMPRYGTTFTDAFALLDPLGYHVLAFTGPRALVEVRPEPGRGDVVLVPSARLESVHERLRARGWSLDALA